MASKDPILTISIAAKLLNIHPRTIMLYEKSNLFSSQRTGTKRRMFSENDLNDLQFIKFLTRKKGINLQGVKVVQDAIYISEKSGLDLKSMLFPEFRAEKLF
jgi:MerR family transcriptional regulator/heat shock protein HspR